MPNRQPRYRRGKLGQDVSAFSQDLEEALSLAQVQSLRIDIGNTPRIRRYPAKRIGGSNAVCQAAVQ